MSYTPTASNAADFTFSGEAYSEQTNFTWDVLAVTKQATGFSTTQFGNTAAAFWQIKDATGIAHTNFGTPTNGLTQAATGATPSTTFGTPGHARAGTATGFQSFNSGTAVSKIEWQVTQFGTPRLFPFHVAPGYVITQFGTPYATSIKRVTTFGIITRFGTPATDSDRTFEASGFTPTLFGTPSFYAAPPPNTHQTLQAYGWATTAFGLPYAAHQQFGDATSVTSTIFGTTAALMGQAATGFTSTTFGLPTALFTARPAGFRPTTFGTPSGRYTLAVSSTQPSIRFGTPTTSRSDSYLATGTCRTWFGHPAGFRRFNKPATGFTGTAFGAPTCRQTHRVTMRPPATAFGTPLLKRNLQC